MKKLILFILLLIATSGIAQSYGNTLGLRMANDNTTRMVGLTFQQKILPHVTIEGIAQTDFNYNSTFHALIERHHSFLTKRFNMYVGAGFSFGSEESQFKDPISNEITTTANNKTLGADLIFGVEATILSYNISMDYKPNFNLTDRNPWYLGQVGVSLRSVVTSNAHQKKKKRKRKRAKKKKERIKKRENEDPWLKDWYEEKIKKKK